MGWAVPGWAGWCPWCYDQQLIVLTLVCTHVCHELELHTFQLSKYGRCWTPCPHKNAGTVVGCCYAWIFIFCVNMLGVIWPEYGHNCSTNRLESTAWGRMHAAVLQLPDARMLLCSVAMLQCFAQKSEIWKHAPRPPGCRLAHGDTSQHGAEMRGYCMQFSWGLCVGLRQKDERNPIKYLLYSPHSRTIINPHMTFTPPPPVEWSAVCSAAAGVPGPGCQLLCT